MYSKGPACTNSVLISVLCMCRTLCCFLHVYSFTKIQRLLDITCISVRPNCHSETPQHSPEAVPAHYLRDHVRGLFYTVSVGSEGHIVELHAQRICHQSSDDPATAAVLSGDGDHSRHFPPVIWAYPSLFYGRYPGVSAFRPGTILLFFST